MMKRKRGKRNSAEQTQNDLHMIQDELKLHLGEHAILYIKQSRDMVPYFIEIFCPDNSGVICGRYKCYGTKCEFRCYQRLSINPIDILTGHQKIVYFDEGI